MPLRHKPASPFRYLNSSPAVIRLVVMMYVRFPLSLRNIEDLLFERGIDICHEAARLWWNRFGPMFAADIRAPAGQPDARVQAVGLEPGRGIREDLAGISAWHKSLALIWRKLFEMRTSVLVAMRLANGLWT
jgi:hypothetical protein